MEHDGDSDLAVCPICGLQYSAPLSSPPGSCKICEDDRQWTPGAGQSWTSIAEMAAKGHRNEVAELEAGVYTITTTPKIGIGQRCFLVPDGSGRFVLWDCVSFVDPVTVEAVEALGGVSKIVVSHPHFLGSCLAWSRRLATQPRVYLHAADRAWVTRPDPDRYVFWEAEELPLGDQGDDEPPSLRAVRLGGHFPGSSILLWARSAAGGAAVAFTSDTILPVPHRRWVSFMFSFPNLLPLPAFEVERLRAAVRALPEAFDRLYGPFATSVIEGGAKAAVLESAERYLDALAGRYHGRA